MENRKWLKRKYPKTFKEVNQFLDDSQLDEFKKRKFKLGRLTNDIIQVQKYKKGNLILFKRTNPINDFMYPTHYGVIKCEVGFTTSGYHSIGILDEDFKELTQ